MQTAHHGADILDIFHIILPVLLDQTFELLKLLFNHHMPPLIKNMSDHFLFSISSLKII